MPITTLMIHELVITSHFGYIAMHYSCNPGYLRK